MQKPDNPYRKNSLIRSVMEGDWEDLTVRQIAEVLKAKQKSVYGAISRIEKETGYSVPHTIEVRGGWRRKKRGVTHEEAEE